MAKTKKKTDIKITSINKNNVVVKKGAKTATVSKKPRQPKKKLEIVDEVKKDEIKEVEIVKKSNSKSKKPVEKKELTQEEIIAQRKERNRKKYQNQQKKYQEAKKNKEKKKIIIEDQVEKVEVKQEEPVKTDEIKEEDLVKKVKEETSVEKDKEKERKEKRKTNRKAVYITQTITNIKEISVTKINSVREKVDDKNIPVGKTKEETVKRSKRLIKESIVYAILLTIIDVLCILIFDYFNFLRLFDVKALNIIVTILISLIFNFFVAFMIDYFVTEIWLKKKRKKEVGGQDGNNRSIEEEHREDIQNQEGE